MSQAEIMRTQSRRQKAADLRGKKLIGILVERFVETGVLPYSAVSTIGKGIWPIAEAYEMLPDNEEGEKAFELFCHALPGIVMEMAKLLKEDRKVDVKTILKT